MPKHVAKATDHPPSDVAFIADAGRPVLAHGRNLGADESMTPHRHPRGQLLWGASGILRVTTDDAVWIVPSSHAVWIPGGTFHHVVTETVARTRNLYVDSAYPLRTDGSGCCMLLLTPLMREIILRLTSDEAPLTDAAGFCHLGQVAMDEIQRLESAALSMPGGTDARLKRAIGHLVRHPNEQCSLGTLAGLAGASPRTLERLFRDETGRTFRQWRSQLRLLGAIEYLNQGASSTKIAYSLGFNSASAFVAAFREHFGCTPQQYLARLPGQGEP